MQTQQGCVQDIIMRKIVHENVVYSNYPHCFKLSSVAGQNASLTNGLKSDATPGIVHLLLPSGLGFLNQ